MSNVDRSIEVFLLTQILTLSFSVFQDRKSFGDTNAMFLTGPKLHTHFFENFFFFFCPELKKKKTPRKKKK